MHLDTDLGHVETAPCHARWANFCHRTKQPTSHLLEDVLLTSLSALPHDGRSTLLRDIAACQKTGQEAADSEERSDQETQGLSPVEKKRTMSMDLHLVLLQSYVRHHLHANHTSFSHQSTLGPHDLHDPTLRRCDGPTLLSDVSAETSAANQRALIDERQWMLVAFRRMMRGRRRRIGRPWWLRGDTMRRKKTRRVNEYDVEPALSGLETIVTKRPPLRGFPGVKGR